MAKVPLRFDHVANPLLEFLRPGKAAVALAFPDELVVDADLEIAAGTRDQRHFAKTVRKRLQQFLGHPAGSQQPVALRAVEDGDARLVHGSSLPSTGYRDGHDYGPEGGEMPSRQTIGGARTKRWRECEKPPARYGGPP